MTYQFHIGALTQAKWKHVSTQRLVCGCHSNFIHNNSKQEAARVSTDGRRMNKPWLPVQRTATQKQKQTRRWGIGQHRRISVHSAVWSEPEVKALKRIHSKTHLHETLKTNLLDRKQIGVRKGQELTVKRYKRTFWGDRNILCLDCGCAYIDRYICEYVCIYMHIYIDIFYSSDRTFEMSPFYSM